MLKKLFLSPRCRAEIFSQVENSGCARWKHIHVRWISISRYISYRVTFNLTANIFLKSSCISSRSPRHQHLHLSPLPVTNSARNHFSYILVSSPHDPPPRVYFSLSAPTCCFFLFTFLRASRWEKHENKLIYGFSELRSMKNWRKIEILIRASFASPKCKLKLCSRRLTALKNWISRFDPAI